MLKTAPQWPSNFSTDWKKWVIDNLKAGCNTAALVEAMVKTGKFPLEVAFKALAAAQYQLSPAYKELELPDVKTDKRLIQLDGRTMTVRAELLSPRVVVIDNVLSPEECAHLVAIANSRTRRAEVIDNKTGLQAIDDGRRSRLAPMDIEDPTLLALERRLSALAGWPIERFETLQAISYGPTDEYKPHYDFFKDDIPSTVSRLRDLGQRVGTFVTYIQEPEEGGSTSFPQAGNIKVHPVLGSTLWFRNVLADGSPDLTTLHAGDPVISGEKWVMSAWLREKTWRGKQ